MSKIAIPLYLIPKLGSRTDACLIAAELRDGRMFANLVVKEGVFITGRRDDPNGEGELPFSTFDICDIQQHAFFLGRPDSGMRG